MSKPDGRNVSNSNSPPPSTLSADERNAWDQLDFFYRKGLAYANEMALRPQTLYAIADSPVGRLFGSSLLGKQARLLRPERSRDPGCRERLSDEIYKRAVFLDLTVPMDRVSSPQLTNRLSPCAVTYMIVVN